MRLDFKCEIAIDRGAARTLARRVKWRIVSFLAMLRMMLHMIANVW